MNQRSLIRADFITAVVLVTLGLATLYGAWTMDRLEIRRIHPASVPGLVPGGLGLAIAICGALLLIRSVRLGGHRPLSGDGSFVQWLRSIEARRLALATVLCLVYPLLLVGWLPFWLATGLFVFAFIVVFEWLPQDGEAAPSPARRRAILFWAAVQAALVAAIVSIVFQELFLVRLP